VIRTLINDPGTMASASGTRLPPTIGIQRGHTSPHLRTSSQERPDHGQGYAGRMLWLPRKTLSGS
jgi:hypothetical protein